MKTFVAPPPLFDQRHNSNRLHYWALNRLQYRPDTHKDIQEHNIQILTQDNLTLNFEITVKINSLIRHHLPLAPPNTTAQSLPPPFITTEIILNTIDIQKRHLDISHSTIHIQDYVTHVFLRLLFFQTLHPFAFWEPKNRNNPSSRTGPQDLLVTHYDCEENE